MARKNKATEPDPSTLGQGADPSISTTTVVDNTKTNQPTKGTTRMADNNNSIITLDANLDDFADYEILPDGNYPGECILAEVRVSANGNAYFYTNWRIATADYPMDYDVQNAPEGTILNFSRVQVPTADDRRSITNVKHLMSALGLKLKTNVIDPSQWVGKRAALNIGHGEYNGEPRNEVKGVENLAA